VPELVCSDITRSLAFYVDLLGFSILYQRREERFAYLERDGVEIMLEQPTGRSFVAAPLESPYGRGMNLAIEVPDVDSLHDAVVTRAPLYLEMEETWYRRDDVLLGNRQFIVQDPDGYLLRFFQDLGTRPV
jgi:catechol 2,3-dioxygenase-like lactoylglutathione lyase family enzyme